MSITTPRRDYRVLNPYMLLLMRQVGQGRLLGSDAGWCWLYEVDESKLPAFDLAYRRVRPVAEHIAERLVLGGWVHAAGTLTDLGRKALASPATAAPTTTEASGE